MSSLQELMTQKLEPDTEDAIQELLRRKVTETASLYVEAVRAAEEAYGPEAKEIIRQRLLERTVRSSRTRGEAAADNSLCVFCYALEAACRGSHEWAKLEDSDSRQAYRFTRCLWAEVFRELGAADIGLWICQGDGPAAAAFNPDIRFKRSQTLMEGDDCCDHVYYTEEGEEG